MDTGNCAEEGIRETGPTYACDGTQSCRGGILPTPPAIAAFEADLETSEHAMPFGMTVTLPQQSLSCGVPTNLRTGVDVRTAKNLMRHSAIAMMADVHACTMRGSLGDAVKRLPDWSTPRAEQLRATGTDGDSVLAVCLARDGSKPAKTVHGGSIQIGDCGESQPLKKTGTYGDSSGMMVNGGDNHLALPPRGFEPLSPA